MSDIWIEVMKELHRAETKHPLWPTDVVYGAAIVAEESGELIQAAVQSQLEGGELEACEREAIQTIVTCIRFVKALKMGSVPNNGGFRTDVIGYENWKSFKGNGSDGDTHTGKV